MAGQRQVLLQLRQLGRGDHRQRVLLAVDGALLQRGGDLRPGHRRGQDADLAEGGDVHRVLGGADLQALGVGGSDHRALAVGEVAEALLAPGQRLEATRREGLQHVLADRAVEHLAGVGEVAHQEGDVEHAGLRHEVQRGAGRQDGEVDGAELQALDDFALAAERAARELLHLEAAAGAGFERLREGLAARAVVRAGRQRIGHLQRGLGGGRGREGEAGSREGGEQRGEPGFAHRYGLRNRGVNSVGACIGKGRRNDLARISLHGSRRPCYRRSVVATRKHRPDRGSTGGAESGF